MRSCGLKNRHRASGVGQEMLWILGLTPHASRLSPSLGIRHQASGTGHQAPGIRQQALIVGFK